MLNWGKPHARFACQVLRNSAGGLTLLSTSSLISSLHTAITDPIAPTTAFVPPKTLL